MSKAVNDIARTLLDELDAEAKSLGDRLQIVNASRAQIHRLLGGKPVKGTVPSSPNEPPPDGAGEKPSRERKNAGGSLIRRGEEQDERAVIGKVIDGVRASEEQAPAEGAAS